MGKTDLGKWMITNGGEYSADATYEQLTMVKYGNSTYITLKTVTGITPVDDKINYQLMAQGFDATALSAVQAEDTQGLCGEKGNIVTAQSLVDALADKVINTVMTKIGTAALTGGMTDLSSGLNKLNSNLKYLNGGYSARITRIKNIQINDYYVYIDLDTSDLPVNKKLSEYPMILVAVNTNTVAEPILYADRAGDRKIRVVFAGTITGTINLCLQYSVSPV